MPTRFPPTRLFTSLTDLHLPATSPALSIATPVAGITNDIDNDPRPAANPDIGADELVQAVGGSFAAGTYYNAAAVDGDSLAGNVTITNTINLGGKLSTGANTLTIGCNASVTGQGPTNYVIGNLDRTFCGAGAKAFDVGTANGYSPVFGERHCRTFPTNVTVTATQGPQPSVNPATSIQRYWTLTGSGITADLTFQYLAGDVIGTEANYKVQGERRDGRCFPTSVVTPATHVELCRRE